MRFESFSTDETENIAAAFAQRAKAGDIFCLQGALGAGKTVFARGLARGLGYTGRVTSPTFTLMHVYEGGRLTVYHFDLYRLEGAADLEGIGCEEYFDAGGLCVLEWPERGAEILPPHVCLIAIKSDLEKGADYREIVVHENIGD